MNDKYLIVDINSSLDLTILTAVIGDETITVDIAQDETTVFTYLNTNSYACVISTVPDSDQQKPFLDLIHTQLKEIPLIVLLTDQNPEILNWSVFKKNTHALWYTGSHPRQLSDSIHRIIKEFEFSDDFGKHMELREVIYNISPILQTQQTHAEIVTETCSHLINTELYNAVWYARYDDDTNTLVPQHAEGVNCQFLNEYSSDDFNLKFISIIDSEENSDSCTVMAPLCSEGSIFGVLFLTTRRAVDTAEQELLAELTDTIIVAIQQVTQNSDKTDMVSTRDLYSQTVSHELRNHLQAIRGRLPHNQNQQVTQIEAHIDQIERLDRKAMLLTKETLDEESITVVQLEDIVNSILDHQPSLVNRISVINSTSFYAHPLLLELLLENLFRNSEEHAGTGVEIRVGRVDDGFFIEDTGNGIPEQIRNSLFEWGFSGNESTGIGLGIVNRIVDLHDWNVTVTDSAEGGARFEITDISELKQTVRYEEGV